MRALTSVAMAASLLLSSSSFANEWVKQPSAEEIQQAQQKFVDETAKKHGLDQEKIQALLQQASFNQSVFEAIQRPWEAKPWHQYYPIFLTEKRLKKGLAFWQTHKETLAKAEQEFGVPAQIIVAIIGVETFYGAYKGKYSVLDALYTLGFHYPPRAKFFSSELGHFMRLVEEEKLSPLDLKGSYAGAMGWGQFISSSYREYAVDFDNDGVRDLLNNPVDAIGSVANYFKRHGWQPNQDVAYSITKAPQNADTLVSKGLKYTDTWDAIQFQGFVLEEGKAPDLNSSAKVFAFEQKDKTEYWLGLPNFYAITRYNHSHLYAMAVYQFSQQLKAQQP